MLRICSEIIDATIVSAPKQRNTDGEKADIRAGRMPEASINFRSPLGVYKYLGQMSQSGTYFPGYATTTAIRLRKDEPFFNAKIGGDDCFTETECNHVTYCVPRESYNTLALIGLAQEVRNLSIQQSDLNSAFTVRVQ